MALPGFAKYFRKSASEELEHAHTLMHYQNERGGRIVLQDIKKPAKDEWGSSLEAMQRALALEKTVNQSLLDLRKLADTHGDFNVSWLLHYTTLIDISPIPLSLSISSLLSSSLSSLPSFLLHLQMANFLETNYLAEQVEAMKKIGDYVTQLENVGAGHGVFHFDHEALGE